MIVRIMNLSGGYRYLFLSLLALLVAYPVFSNAERATPWLDAIVYLVLVAGVFAVGSSRRQFLITALLGLTTFAFLHAADYFSSDWVLVASYVFGIAFFGHLVVQTLRNILIYKQRVTSDLLYGALAAYLMIGVAFAFAYQLFDYVDSNAFDNTGLLSGSTIQAFEGFLYFSFVTMTTLGFGDITPHTPQAGAFVTAQAIIGQMYLAVLVARLVGLQITHQLEEGR